MGMMFYDIRQINVQEHGVTEFQDMVAGENDFYRLT
jgi:hypothetical protein